MESEDLSKFFPVWLEAINKGWVLKQSFGENNYSLRPPEGHKADHWAQRFLIAKLNGVNITYPHFIYELHRKGEL